MQQKHKNFILLLAALICFTVGAVLFGGDRNMAFDQNDDPKGNTTETTNTEQKDDTEETVATAAGASDQSEQNDFFENYRLQRQQRRDAQIELYQSILADDSRDEEAKATAQTALEKLYSVASTEDKVEEILMGRNYKDVIFVMEDSVSLLILKKSSLGQEEEQALASFISSYTGVSADKLSIFTVD